MYRKILLAYDGAPSSAAALDQAVDLARLCGAELHLVGAVTADSATAIAGGIGAKAVPGGYEQHALELLLTGEASDLRQNGMTVETSIRVGHPGREIVSAAEELNADLVVVGHSGKGVLARWFEGSVGSELVNELPCNLLIAMRAA
jgi:nucleotide-binding universal stress UspA family protein